MWLIFLSKIWITWFISIIKQNGKSRHMNFYTYIFIENAILIVRHQRRFWKISSLIQGKFLNLWTIQVWKFSNLFLKKLKYLNSSLTTCHLSVVANQCFTLIRSIGFSTWTYLTRGIFRHRPDTIMQFNVINCRLSLF